MLDEAEIGRLVDCKPEAVCECSGQVELALQPQRHQVFEVPPMRGQVGEYRLYSGRCAGCGKPHAGLLPAGVPKGQLGPTALSLVGVLGTRYHLTQRKIRNLLDQLIDQLMGLRFSVGAISQAHGKVAHALKAPVAKAAALLCRADALWMDETHYPREGMANWVWAAVQPLLAVLAIYPSRARYVILDFITSWPQSGSRGTMRRSLIDRSFKAQRISCCCNSWRWMMSARAPIASPGSLVYPRHFQSPPGNPAC